MSISFDDFQKMEIRIGKIESAERVEGSDKLIKLQINLGSEKRQIVAGIADQFEADQLVGKQIPILANLEPKKFRGIESQGMILVAEDDNKLTLLIPENNVSSGTRVR